MRKNIRAVKLLRIPGIRFSGTRAGHIANTDWTVWALPAYQAHPSFGGRGGIGFLSCPLKGPGGPLKQEPQRQELSGRTGPAVFLCPLSGRTGKEETGKWKQLPGGRGRSRR